MTGPSCSTYCPPKLVIIFIETYEKMQNVKCKIIYTQLIITLVISKSIEMCCYAPLPHIFWEIWIYYLLYPPLSYLAWSHHAHLCNFRNTIHITIHTYMCVYSLCVWTHTRFYLDVAILLVQYKWVLS